MYVETNAALQSIKVISDWLSANKSIKNYNELNCAVSEVYSKLNSAQTTVSTLLEENLILKQQIAELREKNTHEEEFSREISRYALHKLESGMFVYMIKPEHNIEHSPTYLCTECASNKKISFFNVLLNGTRLVCDSCKKNVITGWKPGAHKKP
jgi:cell division protein FtsB